MKNWMEAEEKNVEEIFGIFFISLLLKFSFLKTCFPLTYDS